MVGDIFLLRLKINLNLANLGGKIMAKGKVIFLGPLRGKVKHDKDKKLVVLHRDKWVAIKDHPDLRRMTLVEFVKC
jgi:hypothetical protein